MTTPSAATKLAELQTNTIVHSPAIKLATLQAYPGLWSSNQEIIRFQLQLILKQIPTDPIKAKQFLDIMKLSFQMKPAYLEEIRTWTIEEYIKSTTTKTSEETTTDSETPPPTTT